MNVQTPLQHSARPQSNMAKEIISIFKIIRIASGQTQLEFADKIDSTRESVNGYDHARRAPQVKTSKNVIKEAKRLSRSPAKAKQNFLKYNADWDDEICETLFSVMKKATIEQILSKETIKI